MSSDRTRITFDPDKQYRSVVMQQGRVTLDADWNEAQEIGGETLRADVQDIVGPCGTPDNGYAITLTGSPTEPAFDFQIGQSAVTGGGTMYVGGERVFLPAPITYFQQADWLNGPTPPAPNPPKNEFIYLSLREQEVSAVEDADLIEPALGGPDTAQRTRLVQRIVRLPCSGTDCPSALADAEKLWAAQGPDVAGWNAAAAFGGEASGQSSDESAARRPLRPRRARRVSWRRKSTDSRSDCRLRSQKRRNHVCLGVRQRGVSVPN